MKVSRILIVDDDPVVLEMFSQILLKEGYQVFRASKGREGLRIAQEQRPELVLLDVMLPELGGVEICRQIKCDPALVDVFVVLISGSATRGAEKVAGLESGADEYMLKRIDRDEFLARVRTLLRLRETTAALRAREQHYRQLLEILPDAVALIDFEGKITAINPQVCALLGYDNSEELLKKTVFDITLPDRREDVKTDISSTREGNVLRNREAVLIRKNGERFPVELSAAALKDSEGKPFGIVSVLRDITERKKAEERLLESEQQFRQLTENIKEVIWMTDPAMKKIFYVSPGYEQIWGRTCESLYASPVSWIEAIHPEDRDRVEISTHRVKEAGMFDETYRIIRPDDSIRWIHDRGFPVRDQSGNFYRLAGIAEDITDWKNSEGALRQTEERFRQLAENIREVFWMTNSSKNEMIYVSPGYEEIWGRSCASLYASPRNWVEAIHPDDRERVLTAALTKQASGKYHEVYRIMRPDGSVRWIEDRAFPIRNASGEVYRVVGIADDISDKIRSERRSEAISRLGRRLSAVDTREQAAEIILEIGSELFGWDAGYLSIYSPVDNRMTPLLTVDTVGDQRRQFPPSSAPSEVTPLMRRVMQQGAEVLEPAKGTGPGVKLVPFGNVNRRAASMMIAPMHASGAAIGLISVQSYTASAYTSEDLNALQTLADICGGALKRIEMTEALRSAEVNYRDIFENATEGIFQTTSDGRYLRANPALARMLGYDSPEELMSSVTNIGWQVCSDPESRTVLRQLLEKDGFVREFENEVLCKDGSKRWHGFNARVVRDRNGSVLYFEGTAQDITQRKLAEEALRESEARKSAIMESALDGIITIDRTGKVLEFNSGAEKIIGCSRASAIGKNLASIFVPPALRDWFETGLNRYFAAEEGPMLGGRIETKALRADGAEFPVEFTITRVELEGAAMATIFIRDITTRRRAEAQLAILAHAVESTGEPICITDLDDRFTFVNGAFERAYGYSAGEIIGKSPEVLFSPNNPPSLMGEILSHTRSGGWRGEVLDRRKDGTEFPIFLSTSQIKDQSGRILGLMGVAEDISERKRAEEQIRLLADAVQSTQELVSITDSENRFTFVNEAFVETYGYHTEEILGRTPEILYSANNPEGMCRTVFEQTLAGGWRGELMNRRKDGAELPIFLATSQIKSKTGKIIGLVGVARDVSERRRAEKQNAAFSQLGHRLSGVSEPQQAAKIILDIAAELFGWDAAYVHSYSQLDDKIIPLLTIDAINGKQVPIASASFTLDPSPIMRQVMKEGGQLTNRSKETSIPGYLVPFGDLSRRSASLMHVPIRHRGAAIGVLSVQSYKPKAYSTEDLVLLQALADHCGDTLKRIEVAEALRVAESKYRSIFENATEGIFQTTPDGRYLNANPALARMFGYDSPAQLISSIENIERQTFVSRENALALKLRLAENEPVIGFEAERYRKDGTRFWTSVNVRKVFGPGGEIQYYEGTVQDITRRKQAQKQNRALTGLGYGLSGAISTEQAAGVILDVASELFGWDAAYIHLYSEAENRIIRVLTMDTVNGKKVPTPPIRTTSDPSPMTRLIIKEGALLVKAGDKSPQAAERQLFGNTARRSASMMYVPIHSEGAPVGILSIQSYTAGAYSVEDLRLLQTMADDCGDAFQRIKVTDALGEAEAKYRSIFENVTEGIFRTTPDGQLLSANPALAQMFGYHSPEEMMSSILNVEQQIYVSPGNRIELKRLLEAQESVRGFEAENHRKDGSRIWISLNGHAVRDARGAVLCYQGTIQDITGRKWTENLLRVQRDFGVLLSSTNDLRVAVDRLLRIALQSDGVDCGAVYLVFPETGGLELAAQHGLSARFLKRASNFPIESTGSRARMHRQPLAAIVHQLKREHLCAEELIPLQHSGRVVAVLVVGSHVQGEIPPRSRQALDAFAAQAGGALARIRAEQLLQANRQLLDKTLNSLHDGVLLLDAKSGIVQDCNMAATRIFDYSREEMIGRTPNFLHPTEALLEQFSQHLPEGTHERGFRGEFELKMKRRDGTLFPTEHSLTAIKDEAGELISWVNVVRDITERKRVEGELRQLSQRIIEAQEAERSRVARELHDGVNQIIASAKMRLRKVQDLGVSPAAREILARCDRLLVQALEENRRIAHDLRPSDLDELGWASACRNFCKEVQARANLAVKCRITRLTHRMPPGVELNLFRVVQEALSNVEKHARAKTVRLQVSVQHGFISLHIRDDGTGFDLQRAKAHKQRRAGLGLSNMRERCAALGGAYEIESAPGRGTRITVRIPFEKVRPSTAGN